jgi:hypothetical protein
MRLPLQLMLALLASTVVPSDITTRDGATYKHAEVTGVDADGLSITHSNGVTKVPFDNLPDALQKQYNYDPAKVAADRKMREDAAAEMAAARQREWDRMEQEARVKFEEQARQEKERAKREQIQKVPGAIGRGLAIILAIAVGLFLYFFPSIVGRHKANALAIFIFNLFLGWTFVGWVLALVWACTKEPGVETHESVGDFREP